MLGTVKYVNAGGYGFIHISNKSTQSFFFHKSSLKAGLKFDDTLFDRVVEFEEGMNQRGVIAINIRPVAEPTRA